MTGTTTSGDAARRRGTVYVLFMGISALVIVIGLTAVAVSRAEVRAARGAGDVELARRNAVAAIELALLTISLDDAWRSTYASDAWQPKTVVGEGGMQWGLVDEANGSLGADPTAPVRVYGRGTHRDAVWVYSVEAHAPPTVASASADSLVDELIVNGDMEDGLTGWTKWKCDIETSTDDPHGGATCIRVRNRHNVDDSGPYQDVTSDIVSGTEYQIDVWARLKDNPEDVTVLLWVQASGGPPFGVPVTAPCGTDWTLISGTVTPTWTGSLTFADVMVTTTVSDQEFYVDDMTMQPVPGAPATTVGPVAGTWRRELDEFGPASDAPVGGPVVFSP